MADRTTMGVILSVDKTTIPGSTWVEIADLTTFDGPSETVSSLDRTTLASPARRFRPGLYQAGEFTFEFFFDPADVNHAWLQGRVKARGTYAFKLSIPEDGTTDPEYDLKFNGFVTEFALSGSGVDEFITASVTIQIDGEATYAAVP